jgi:hypothetical protein
MSLDDAGRAADESSHDALPLQPASEGVGPFVERDYWAVIEDCRCSPADVLTRVREHFVELPPPSIVIFERCDGDGTLELGDELDIDILLAGDAKVRVVHVDACSITLATIAGHPEAGRITFGAYRADDGRVIFHIRSRARASTAANLVGFLFGGDPMQTSTWTDFVTNVALSCGTGVAGSVHADTRTIDPEALEPGDLRMDCPTFVARGD